MSVNSGYFTFAGVSSADYDVAIANVPNMNRPARKQTIIEIPGRSGNLVFPEDAWQNVQQEYEIFRGTGTTAATKDAREFITLLHGVKGYQRLTDSFDPEIYRLAYLDGEIQMENTRNRIWRAGISFSCRPERYLLTGEVVSPITSSGSAITNPTAYNSKPLIKITGSGKVTLSINGNTALSVTNVQGYINLDCEEQDAYKTLADNQNDNVVLPDGHSYPVLVPGSNSISWTGTVTAVEITPRWWEL